jgi:alkylation response protein AidB-like acyl-CoA dehydrogenase
MDASFTEDQQLFAQTVAQVLADRCPPEAVRAAWSDQAGPQSPAWSALVEMGLTSLIVPEAHEGYGLGMVDLVSCLLEAGRACLPDQLTQQATFVTPLLAAVVDDPSADPAVQDLLGQVLAGATLGVVWSGGPGASSLVAGCRSHAGYLAMEANTLVYVSAADAQLADRRSVDASRQLAHVAWDPPSQVRLASGPDVRAAWELAGERAMVGTAAECCGLARALIDITVAYVLDRHQFGVAIGSFQAVKHQLADALMKVTFAEPLVARAAWSLDTDDPDRIADVSAAKSAAADAADVASRVALQLHGAIGYTFEYDLQLWMKRVYALREQWGSAGEHRNRIALKLGLRSS